MTQGLDGLQIRWEEEEEEEEEQVVIQLLWNSKKAILAHYMGISCGRIIMVLIW
jgi:hypothetical protein